MSALLPDKNCPSRPKKGMVRERFMATKNAAIDCGLGKADSWAKKVSSGECGVTLDDIELLLDVLGMRVVDKTHVVIDKGVLESYKTIATVALAHPEKLGWSD